MAGCSWSSYGFKRRLWFNNFYYREKQKFVVFCLCALLSSMFWMYYYNLVIPMVIRVTCQFQTRGEFFYCVNLFFTKLNIYRTKRQDISTIFNIRQDPWNRRRCKVLHEQVVFIPEELKWHPAYSNILISSLS